MKVFLVFIIFLSSCSFISGPEGYFPDKKNDFLKEKIEEDIALPGSLSEPSTENHYPVIDLSLIHI